MPNVVPLITEVFMDRKEYEAGLIRRTRLLRERHGVDQETMAQMLGILAGTYRKYEGRSPLPDYLKARFCMIVKCDLHYYITGHKQAKLKPVADTMPKVATLRA